MAKQRGRPKKFKAGEIRFGEELDTPEKIKAAVALFVNGRNTKFWKILAQILDYNISETERKILEDDTITPDEREKYRMWRYYQVELRNLPENLIAKYMDTEKVITPTEDPYE